MSSAFADSATRALVMLARRARSSQDSSLRGYDAKTQARLTVSLRTSALMPNKLLFRTENVSSVKWRRGQGMWIEALASRNTMPTGKKAMVSGVATTLIPVPYFPGRDQLWLPGGDLSVVKQDVDASEGFVHPLAQGSEAYYRYQIADAIRIRLPNGDQLTLRELKVTARRPEWRSFVGSFWFDEGSGSLVRAAYRLSAPVEIWNEAMADVQRDLDDAARDTTPNRVKRTAEATAAKEAMGPAVVRAIINPMSFDITLVTVEYALHEGRFWLPHVNRAEGKTQVAFMRLPFVIEESYKYDDVTGSSALPALPFLAAAKQTSGSLQLCAPACLDLKLEEDEAAPVPRLRRRQITDSLLTSAGLEPVLIADTTARANRVRGVGDSLYRVFRDSTQALDLRLRYASRDSLLRMMGRSVPAVDDSSRDARRARSFGDSLYNASVHTARRRVRDAECAATGGFYTRAETRFEGALRYGLKLPCDSTVLASSNELPPSPYDANEAAFPAGDAAQLASALDIGLQSGLGSQPLQFDYSLSRHRYNRVEGLSLGTQLSWPLGAGYTAIGEVRLGFADWQPNGGIRVERSNGRKTVHLAAFRRLSATNDFGDPLSVGASLSALLYGRDEGFYYRTLGAEMMWMQQTSRSQIRWRLFGERHDPAQTESNFNILRAFSRNRYMLENITARRGQVAGAAAEWHAGYGLDPNGWTLATDVRAEGAAGSFNYARGLADLTIARGLIWRLAFGQTVSMGVATDSVPVQRQFYIGGLRTVRGQLPGTQIGDTYWLSRSEVGVGSASARPTVFLDLGWAGRRADFARPGRPQAGWGVGASFLGGAFRTDVSRGIYPRRGTRADISLGARF